MKRVRMVCIMCTATVAQFVFGAMWADLQCKQWGHNHGTGKSIAGNAWVVMHDVILKSQMPRHVDIARLKNGLSMVDYQGDDNADTLKLAHWRAQLRDVHTTPRDDFHTIWFHGSGASVRRKGFHGVLTPGTVFLQPAQDDGVFNSEGELDYFHIYLSIKALQDLSDEVDTRAAQRARVPVEFGCRDADLTRVVAEHIARLKSRSDPSGIELEEWTVNIGMALLRYATQLEENEVVGGAKSSLSAMQMRDVVDFVESRISTRIMLSDLAALCGFSQFRFMRAFKAETGFNPHQYVIERRVARAKSLLQDSDATIADIAYDVGFSSQAHMTDVFRKRVGATPGQFRRTMRR